MSATKDNHYGIDEVQRLGINCAQIFGTNKIQWKPREYHPLQVQTFRAVRESAIPGPIYSHGIYLINLGARDENPEIYEKSVHALAAGLKICALLRLDGLIFHLGSNYGLGLKAVLESVVVGLTRARELSECDVPLILENSAGSERVIGGRFSDFATIINELNGDSRISICIDTAHAFAFGYDLANTQGLEQLTSEIESTLGFDRIATLHLNDSKIECGGALDRHANLGEGHIGYSGLAGILNHPYLKFLPTMLETPGFDGRGPDRGNIEIMRALAGCLDVDPEILARRAKQRARYRARHTSQKNKRTLHIHE